jgi:hypothetical protein
MPTPLLNRHTTTPWRPLRVVATLWITPVRWLLFLGCVIAAAALHMAWCDHEWPADCEPLVTIYGGVFYVHMEPAYLQLGVITVAWGSSVAESIFLGLCLPLLLLLLGASVIPTPREVPRLRWPIRAAIGLGLLVVALTLLFPGWPSVLFGDGVLRFGSRSPW